MTMEATAQEQVNPMPQQNTDNIVVSHQSVSTAVLILGLLSSTICTVWFMSREITRIDERGGATQQMLLERTRVTDEKIDLLRGDISRLSERIDHLMSQ